MLDRLIAEKSEQKKKPQAIEAKAKSAPNLRKIEKQVEKYQKFIRPKPKTNHL